MNNTIRITDFENEELDIYARLSEVQIKTIYEPAPGIFIGESPKVIERALDSGYEPISCLVEDRLVDSGETAMVLSKCLSKYPHLPIYTAAFEVLTQLTGFKLTRGMLCAFRRKELPSVAEICRGTRRIAILENVMNPTNVGAIFRSAAALQMDAVLLTGGCSDPLYRRSVRVSMGNVFLIPWTYIPSGEWCQTTFDSLASLGFKTAAMALRDNTVSIDDPGLLQEEKIALVLGTEGEGLCDETIKACDYTVKIPMAPGVDSLNVAAASAVAFWQLGR